MASEHVHSCCEHEHKRKPWYKNIFILTGLVTAVLLAASFIFSPLAPFQSSFMNYIRMMAWPIFLGFLVGGLIDYYIPKEYISKHLAQSKRRTILYAVGLGFFASACSHGVISLSMELHKKGASGPAVISFLLASPWASLPITLILIGFFGWKAFLIIGSALFVAMNTGLIFQKLEKKGWIEKNKHSVQVASEFSIRKDMASRMKNYHWTFNQLRQDIQGVAKGMSALAQMVFGWILIGVLLASLAGAFVPAHLFHRFLGPSFLGLLITLGIAAILEVCSEGTSPLAFEIYKQTGALGNAFAFLMGGVVTDYTEIGLVWQNLGKKTALWMLGITLPQVLLLGWFFNLLF